MGELALEVDGDGDGGVDPADEGDVGDGVAAASGADEVVPAGGEVGLGDAVEALGLADVALDAPVYADGGGGYEVVCLALPGRGSALFWDVEGEVKEVVEVKRGVKKGGERREEWLKRKRGSRMEISDRDKGGDSKRR